MKDKEISQKITRFLNGDLNNEEIDQLWEEFLKNPELFSQFETEVNLHDMFRKEKAASVSGKKNEPDAINKLHSYKIWLYSAAAAVLISVGLQLFSVQQGELLQRSALASIDVTEMMGADIFRGDEEVSNDLDISINAALAKALDEEFDEALSILENLLEEELTPQQFGRVSLNLGILSYNKADYQRSVYHFQQVLDTESLPEFFDEKAWWFMGNAYLNLKETENAREAVFNAYTMDGRFASPALSLLKKLDVELGRIPAEMPEPAR